MKQADGWLLSAFSCRQAFILEVEVPQVLPLQGVPTVQVKMFLGVIKSFHIGFLSYMASFRSL